MHYGLNYEKFVSVVNWFRGGFFFVSFFFALSSLFPQCGWGNFGHFRGGVRMGCFHF